MLNPKLTCTVCKPKPHFIEQNGFIPKLMLICVRELKKAGFPVKAEKLQEGVLLSKNFGEALAVMSKHLDMR